MLKFRPPKISWKNLCMKNPSLSQWCYATTIRGGGFSPISPHAYYIRHWIGWYRSLNSLAHQNLRICVFLSLKGKGWGGVGVVFVSPNKRYRCVWSRTVGHKCRWFVADGLRRHGTAPNRVAGVGHGEVWLRSSTAAVGCYRPIYTVKRKAQPAKHKHTLSFSHCLTQLLVRPTSGLLDDCRARLVVIRLT